MSFIYDSERLIFYNDVSCVYLYVFCYVRHQLILSGKNDSIFNHSDYHVSCKILNLVGTLSQYKTYKYKSRKKTKQSRIFKISSTITMIGSLIIIS